VEFNRKSKFEENLRNGSAFQHLESCQPESAWVGSCEIQSRNPASAQSERFMGKLQAGEQEEHI